MSSKDVPRLNAHQVTALDNFACDAGRSRGGKFVVDGTPHRLAEDDPKSPLEIWLFNSAGATACVHVTFDGRLEEV